MSEPLLEVEDLTIQYETPSGDLTAVSGANFSIDRGEYFGLVGESGCGKSTIARSLIGGLDDNGKIAEGTIRYQGTEIQDYSESQLNRELRWREISYIPQGSMNSLDPLSRVSEQAAEIADVHSDMGKAAAIERIRELFGVVGINPERVTEYPHQFSGGMQQRAIIALSLFLEPNLIVADEPTTALDVIMQDQIFKYLDEIRDTIDTSVLLITHDISLVFESCDDLAIMHGGQVCETGSITDIYDEPRHPYSILLQEAFPDLRYPDQELEIIEGTPPQSFGEVNSCTFADRCPWAIEECREAAPPLEALADDPDHFAACVRKEEVLENYRTEGIDRGSAAASGRGDDD